MDSTFHYDSISEYLKAELQRRKALLKSYSLRSFAKDLEISPSRLSEVLSARQGLSAKFAEKISAKLKLSPKEAQFWLDLILAENSTNEKVREFAASRMSKARLSNDRSQLKADQQQIVSNWFFIAILEMTLLHDFQPNVSWISERLGMNPDQVQIAIDKLFSLGLLSLEVSHSDEVKWVAKPEVFRSFGSIPRDKLNQFHRQILKMHSDAIGEASDSDRITQAMIVAIPKNSLAQFEFEFQELLSRFWSKNADQEKEELVLLSLNLSPVKKQSKETVAHA